MIENEPQSWYLQHLSHIENVLGSRMRKRRMLAWLRFASLVIAFTLLWILWSAGIAYALLAFALAMTAFLFIVAVDIKNSEKINHLNTLGGIVKNELSVLQHQFSRNDAGDQLKPANHDYAHDLDIFGKASLYQYCNRTRSEQGNQLMSNWLLAPATNQQIKERQESVRELTQMTEWRIELEAFGIENNLLTSTEKRITTWLQEKNSFVNNTAWKMLQVILPTSAVTTLILHITGTLTAQWFYAFVFLFLLLSLAISKKVMPQYHQLNKITREMATLSASTRHIEQASFKSSLLVSLKNEFGTGRDTASIAVKKLHAILDRLDIRLNPLVFLPLNTFLFWDLHQVLALEKWKQVHAQGIAKWFAALSQTEVLSSFGTLYFNNPGWVFPTLTDEDGIFISKDLGHPLITEGKRVVSSFTSTGLPRINLVTGSNMAGKSTFLRSVGVNVVLAMAGAPVCATEMKLSNLKIMSSMRVSDNLEESVSTFYAELKKLKLVIDAVNRKEKVILLLDEILRGTNSGDRHTGSSALIRQLIHHHAMGLVATHDLELAKLDIEFPRLLCNYHFDVQVANEELYFDYKLKEGVCRSMNASLLMRKIGIEIDKR